MKYNRATIFFLAFLLKIYGLNAQPDEYWQQEVNYNIQVTLNDVNHELYGNLTIEYINNSPDKLTFIYFHLWPNAYKDLNTAFAEQQLQNESTAFYFSEEKDRGYINGLNFNVNGEQVSWSLDSNHIDVCKVFLEEPLKSGDKIFISTPFHVKIPDNFSRLGHLRQSYQITQWYPKPAVYDKNGWHPMPYLDQGEFYAEFGSYDVKIKLPRNYIVGASGTLQNEDELVWLNELAEETSRMGFTSRMHYSPPSDTAFKVLHYKIDHAHDFAWFADKRYRVLKADLALPNSNRTVTIWSLFTDYNAALWQNSIEYAKDGLLKYAEWIGDYPYNTVTVVEGAIHAGGGMEYPAITVIGYASDALELETIIVHEVGHNWFYGAIGSNERKHPWMDEGINSYYETRYIKAKYPDLDLAYKLKPGLKKLLDLDQYKRRYLNELNYRLSASRHQDQPIELPSDEYTYLNYGAIVYSKSALAFEYLNSYLGDSLFDAAFQQYYEVWKFQHPQPEDLQSIFEQVSGKKLDWFFEDIINSTEKVDYKISKVKRDRNYDSVDEIKLKNTSSIKAPISLSAIRNDSVIKTYWYSGFEGTKKIQIVNDGYHEYHIDAGKNTLDFNRQNNQYRLRGLLSKVERLRFQLFGSLNNTHRTQLFFMPIAGWNNYDKTVVGLAFYNHTLPFKTFEFELAPMIGTASSQFAYLARAGYTFYLKASRLHHINFSIASRRFSYLLFPDPLTFNRVQPVLTFEFRKKDPRSSITKKLALRSVNIIQEEQSLQGQDMERHHYTVNGVNFSWTNNRVINPYNFSVSLEQGNEYLKAFGEINYKLTYNNPKKGFNVRLFAGGFFVENVNKLSAPIPFLRMTSRTGHYLLEKQQNDYLYDEFYLGRSENKAFLSQQIVTKDGGFRALIPLNQQRFGISQSWLASININSTLPGRIPVRPYIGFGTFGQPNSKFNVAFELGLALVIVEDIIEVNFPIVTIASDPVGDIKKWFIGMNTDDFNNEHLYQRIKYWELISFQLNIKKLNPFELIKEIPL